MTDTNTHDPMELSEDDKAAFAAMQNEAYKPQEQHKKVEEEEEVVVETSQEDDIEDDDTDGEEVGAKGQKPGFVPHRKLHKAIEKTKAVQAELDKEREERTRLDERMNLMMERLKAPEKKEEAVAAAPSAEDDIFGAFEHNAKRVSTIEEKLAAYEKQQETNSRIGRVVNAASAAEQSFVKEAPDYFDALNHLRTSRIKEFERMGANEAQAKARLQQEELQFAARALQRNSNPAKEIYEWAVERGYQKSNAETQKERIEKAADAQTRSKTLSGGGNGGPTGSSKARALLEMSDNEFHEFMTKKPEELRKIMMG